MVKKRFPVVPTVAVILKIAAVLFLILSTIALVYQVQQALKQPMSGIKLTWDIYVKIISGWFEQALFPAGFAWVAAEIILGIRDIEYNTRYALVSALQAAGVTTAPVMEPENAPGTPVEEAATEEGTAVEEEAAPEEPEEPKKPGKPEKPAA